MRSLVGWVRVRLTPQTPQCLNSHHSWKHENISPWHLPSPQETNKSVPVKPQVHYRSISSGSRNFREGGYSMKYKPTWLEAIFFMTNFYTPGGGGMAPWHPPGSATVHCVLVILSCWQKLNERNFLPHNIRVVLKDCAMNYVCGSRSIIDHSTQ